MDLFLRHFLNPSGSGYAQKRNFCADDGSYGISSTFDSPPCRNWYFFFTVSCCVFHPKRDSVVIHICSLYLLTRDMYICILYNGSLSRKDVVNNKRAPKRGNVTGRVIVGDHHRSTTFNHTTTTQPQGCRGQCRNVSRRSPR